MTQMSDHIYETTKHYAAKIIATNSEPALILSTEDHVPFGCVAAKFHFWGSEDEPLPRISLEHEGVAMLDQEGILAAIKALEEFLIPAPQAEEE